MAFVGTRISSKKLKLLIDERFGSVALFARKLEVASGTVFNWLKSETPGVDPETFLRMVKMLNLNASYLRPAEPPPGISQTPAPVPDMPSWTIDLTASAWAYAPVGELDYDDEEQRKTVNAGRFMLTIIGNCMDTDYPDGTAIVFEVIRVAGDGPEVNNDYCFCRIDGMATFKKLVAIDEDWYTLAATNQKNYPGTFKVGRQEIGRMARVVNRILPPAAARAIKILKPK